MEAPMGANTTVVEGIVIGEEDVLGAHATLTSSMKIFDISQAGNSKEYHGYVPPRAVVMAGVYPKAFPARVFGTLVLFIIDQYAPHTHLKTSLSETPGK
jgi:2,3,4,5-tetrahydropyridine-2-carboxylate N-succinyltransferase